MSHPKHANVIITAEGWPIRGNHAEHAVKLPVDEEYDEQMMGVPEPLKVRTTPFFRGIEYQDEQTCDHDPSGDAGTCGKVDGKEGTDALACGCRVRVCYGKLVEIDHVRQNMNDGPDDD